MTEPMILALIAAVSGVATSSGFWAYFQKRSSKHTATDRLLMGLAYEKIVTLGMAYIERGWISKDEFEELRKYLFEPYKEMGGNGVAERIMVDVGSLPFRSFRLQEIILKEKEK
jgi:hypothetical protein